MKVEIVMSTWTHSKGLLRGDFIDPSFVILAQFFFSLIELQVNLELQVGERGLLGTA
jgi:hypothetical protein